MITPQDHKSLVGEENADIARTGIMHPAIKPTEGENSHAGTLSSVKPTTCALRRTCAFLLDRRKVFIAIAICE